MPDPLIIIAIISGIFALVVEIVCSKQESKILWLGSVCLFFFVNALYYSFFAPDPAKQTIWDRILMFIIVGMVSAVISMAVASILLALIAPKKEDEDEATESVIKLGEEEKKEE